MQNTVLPFCDSVHARLISCCLKPQLVSKLACILEKGRFSLFVLLALLITSAQADELLIERGMSGVAINNRLASANDVPESTPLSQMIAESHRFTPASGRCGTRFATGTHWMRLDFRRAESERGAPWWLVVEPLNLYDLRVYRRNAYGEFEEFNSGERVSFADGREREWRQYAFKLPEHGPVYLRIYDPSCASFPIALWHQEDLEHHERLGELLLGGIYGGLLVICLYNLFLSISLRDSAYGWHAVTTMALGVFLVYLHGHAAQWWWQEWPDWVVMGRVVLPSLWGLSLIGFVMSFFDTSRFLPQAHLILKAIVLSYLLIITMRLAGAHVLPSLVLTVQSLPVVALVLFVAIRRWYQGMAGARYFLAAYGTVLTGSVIFLFSICDLMATNRVTELAMPVAATLGSLMFSLALAGRIRSLRRASEAALIDELTGLPNRRALEQRFKQYADSEEGQDFSLITVDLDKFKPINDQWGHAEGDQVLRILAQRMQSCVRHEDLVARVGGDEFAVLLSPSAGRGMINDVVDRLLEATHKPIHLGKRCHSLSASVGLAHYPSDGRSLSELSRKADIAMYQAKRAGGDTWRESMKD